RPQTVNITKTMFAPNVFAIYAANAAAATTVWNINQTFIGPAPVNNQLVFAGDADGTKLNFTNVVFYAGPIKVSQLVNNNRSNIWNFIHCTATETGVGGATNSGRKFLNIGLAAAPNYGNGTNGTYNFQNCIFNWPGSPDVQIVAGAGLGKPAVVAGTNLLWVGGLNSADAFSGAGTQINLDPKMQADGYHITSISPAAAAGAPNFSAVDIDGVARPITAPNPCLGATETGKGVLTLVSGGGGALQAAIDAANPYDWLQVTDSLDYSPVSVGKILTIFSTNSTHPRVVSDPGIGNGTAVTVSAAGDTGGMWSGIDVVQTATSSGAHNVFFLANNGTKNVYTVQNMTLAITTTDFVDARGSFWGNPVHLINVTIFRNDSGFFNPLLWFGDNC